MNGRLSSFHLLHTKIAMNVIKVVIRFTRVTQMFLQVHSHFHGSPRFTYVNFIARITDYAIIYNSFLSIT